MLQKHNLFTILMLALAGTLLIFTACEDEEEPTNSAPTSTITSPEDGAEFTQGETITIIVDAVDEDENLEEVRFYVNDVGVGSVSSLPYSFDWDTSDEEPGSFIIKAEAIDEAQEKTSDEINITLTTSGSGDFELITVSGGAFDMGCTDEQNNCGSDETPVHTVTVDDFQISKYEITNQQYADFMNEIGAGSDGSYNGTEYLDMADSDCEVDYSGGQFVPESGQENHPVIEVTWYGAKAFCEHHGGRLPTEAEWEFAARGGNSATATLYAGS
ncbi:MAG TPA: SUMF1/EgtB/PvdO family nonheme iron enzyme, partial [Salinivirga sp.]|uniref:SUMF1/EgtB/PvdO family nonheme iron enzyme n=1 Tax=Salinivirga sp. TaxID=1970192 RepID=UPI002B4850A5